MTSRPILLTRIATISAIAVVVVFVIVALLMKRDNAGAVFGDKDQVATVVVGVVIALAILLLTRPRLIADDQSVRTRSFSGDFRVVPWDVIVGIEFPSNARFARLVLPGDEILAIYAVQRLDKEHSVEIMRRLRALQAEVRATRERGVDGSGEGRGDSDPASG
ncbi:MAG: PH domain-containing protein [Actinobacteria bacterium]|nr:PH domain-containing protein [Actinomycetota bacterium]